MFISNFGWTLFLHNGVVGDHREGTAHKGPAQFGLNCGEITISEIYWKASQIFKIIYIYAASIIIILITTLSRRNLTKIYITKICHY